MERSSTHIMLRRNFQVTINLFTFNKITGKLIDTHNNVTTLYYMYKCYLRDYMFQY